jgi:hypothetical protein
LLQIITIETPEGDKRIWALFNTGASVFILNQEQVQINNIFVMENAKPITLLVFFRQEEKLFGKYFTPLLNIKIENHTSQVSCETGPLKKGMDTIIPGGWFMVEHLMSFKGNGIQVKQQICDPESIISYDEIVWDVVEAV